MLAKVLHPSRRGFVGLLGAALVWPRAGFAEALDAVEGTAFGTSWRIVGPSGSGLGRLRPGIEALFDGIDREMSPWRRDSTVSRFNAGRAGWHRTSDEMARVTGAALSLAKASGGAFDPTVGPLVARWGFGPIDGGGAPDWRGIATASGRIAKARDDLTLDLCGIAKGRALDRAIEFAQSQGVRNLLIDLGGELRALGSHPAGRPWRVAVEHPVPGRPAPAVIELPVGSAVATSGLRAQSYVLGDRTYGHIIDPVAGSPTDGELRSVTVLAAEAMTADGWATALFAAGDRAGPALGQAHGIAALFLYGDAPSPRQVRTGAIEAAMT